MEFLLNVGLPLSLAFIMFSLGVGLTGADFARVVKEPRAFLTGAVAQILLLPVVAFALLHIFTLDSALAVGVMILAFSPGGVTTNILTRLAGGTVALSVSLTAIISLTTALTLPIMLALVTGYFEGADAPEIDILSISITMFLITTVPVLIGLAFRHLLTGVAVRIEPVLIKIATLLFVVIILAALASAWGVFTANLPTLAPLLVVMNLVLLAIGMGLARAMGLSREDGVAIAIETGVQNGTLGVAVGALISGGAALGAYSLASGVYGITMYLVTLPIIFLVLRRK
ncbi:MAG: bile acid:sodium symporter family protein [Pseudomonadota bacterium]